jgi:hypothetical protein
MVNILKKCVENKKIFCNIIMPCLENPLKPVIEFDVYHALPNDNANPPYVFDPEILPVFNDFVNFTKTINESLVRNVFKQVIIKKPEPIIPMSTDAERAEAAANREASAIAAFHTFDIAYRFAKKELTRYPPLTLLEDVEIALTLLQTFYNKDGLKRKTLRDTYHINHPEYLFIYNINTVVHPYHPLGEIEVNVRNFSLLVNKYPPEQFCIEKRVANHVYFRDENKLPQLKITKT